MWSSVPATVATATPEMTVKSQNSSIGNFRLRVALSRRIAVYNEQLALVERMEDEGRIICIRPQRPMDVDRMTKDAGRLEALYEEGFQLGCDFCRKFG